MSAKVCIGIELKFEKCLSKSVQCIYSLHYVQREYIHGLSNGLVVDEEVDGVPNHVGRTGHNRKGTQEDGD